MSEQTTPLILVCGMHRSGTSLLGSILQALGAALPGPLVAADAHNPSGYFEHHAICSQQEQLLIALGRWWPAEAGCQPLPPGWQQAECTRHAAAQLQALLRRNQALQSGPWVLKDPRTSLLLPLWRELAASLNLPLRLVLAIRHPGEVVASLLKRDRVSAGMTAARAERLWQRHNLAVLEQGGALPLHVVDYQHWFEQPQVCLEALADFCGLPLLNTARSDALGRICAAHHHQRRSNAAEASLAAGTLHLWQQLHQLANNALLPHPWLRAAQGLCSNPKDGMALVQRWWEQGVDDTHQQALLAAAPPAGESTPPGGWPDQLQLTLVGARRSDWFVHSLLHRLAIPSGTHWLEERRAEATQLVLHLGPLNQPEHWRALLGLPKAAWVFTLSNERAALLRSLGLRAMAVPSTIPAQAGWLLQPQDSDHTATALGLPSPAALAKLRPVLCLGDGRHPDWADAAGHRLWQIPPVRELCGGSEQRARLLASWLLGCNLAGLTLVELGDAAPGLRLIQPQALRFQDPISPEEVLHEWQWHQQGRPAAAPLQTPEPSHELLWSHRRPGIASASVAISLHNYADWIDTALDSAAAQTHQALELILVDDHSSDASIDRALAWLERHGQRFQRSVLLRHAANAGLAAARNTAFAAAEAPWVFVLDADNQLHPEAVAHCLELAEASPALTAMVHPILKLETSHGHPSQPLVGRMPWRRDLLRRGNYIDAMALVRRSAWGQVGGYRHCPEGWEDFDFWCQLVEAGFHGVICPAALATYCQHSDSMLQSRTNHRLRTLSRRMQALHPWLDLPLAKPDR